MIVGSDTMRCLRGVLRPIVTWLAYITIAIVLITILYFIAEPFSTFAEWFNASNILHRAIIVVLAPFVAAYADQVRDNLSEQGKRDECKSLRRALKQAQDTQALEISMRWLAWVSLAAVGIALVQIVDLF